MSTAERRRQEVFAIRLDRATRDWLRSEAERLSRETGRKVGARSVARQVIERAAGAEAHPGSTFIAWLTRFRKKHGADLPGHEELERRRRLLDAEPHPPGASRKKRRP